MEDKGLASFVNKIDKLITQINSMDKKLTQIETRMEFRPAKICVEYMEDRFVSKAEIDRIIENKKIKDEECFIRKSSMFEKSIKIIQLILTLSIFSLLALQGLSDNIDYKHNTITELKE